MSLSAYKVLREEAPVWKDPISGIYVIKGDIKTFIDTETFEINISGSHEYKI